MGALSGGRLEMVLLRHGVFGDQPKTGRLRALDGQLDDVADCLDAIAKVRVGFNEHLRIAGAVAGHEERGASAGQRFDRGIAADDGELGVSVQFGGLTGQGDWVECDLDLLFV